MYCRPDNFFFYVFVSVGDNVYIMLICRGVGLLVAYCVIDNVWQRRSVLGIFDISFLRL